MNRSKIPLEDRKNTSFRWRGYRARLVKQHTGSLDGQELFDLCGEQKVDEDWRMYLKAKLYGLGSIGDPPAWLVRDIRAEEGMLALRTHNSSFDLSPREEEAIQKCCISPRLLGSELAEETGRSKKTVSAQLVSALKKIKEASIAKWEPEENL